ncbi:MAG: hypothetical protein HY761_09030 [Candidatus Omnitrophica bacterium]|nr:hypothetical protein [Candidatus Omnitrophota bacterium]
MKKKYAPPIAVDFSDQLKEAATMATCTSGSSATTGRCSTGGSALGQCTPGTSATAGLCRSGGTAVGSCRNGTSPIFTCRTGGRAF